MQQSDQKLQLLKPLALQVVQGNDLEKGLSLRFNIPVADDNFLISISSSTSNIGSLCGRSFI